MADVHWVGRAAARKQVSLLTLGGGPWVAGETITITSGTQDLIVTIGAGVTADNIRDELIASINATNATTPTPATGYSRNFGGQELSHFGRFTASSGGAGVVALTSTSSVGRPFVVTATETSAAGTITVSTPTAATGPHHASNPDNYLDGALPGAGDTVVFDIGAVDCLYDLTYFRANTIAHHVRVTNDFTGGIGLNAVDDAGIPEYLPRAWQLYNNVGGFIYVQPSSQGSTAATKRIYIDRQGQNGGAFITASRGGGPTQVGVTLIGGNGAGGGYTDYYHALGIEIDPLDFAISNYVKYSELEIGVQGSTVAGLVRMTSFNGAIAAAGTFVIRSGEVQLIGGTWNHTAGIDVVGGTLRLMGASVTLVNVHSGATVKPELSNAGEYKVFGGTLDGRGVSANSTPGACRLYPGSSFYDPTGHVAGIVDLRGSSTTQLPVFVLPPNRQVDYTAAAS